MANARASGSRASLLADHEPPVHRIVNRDGPSPCVVLCDHASNRIPQALARLGLDRRHLGEHIAWDIGALTTAEKLADELDAPLVATAYSRLVIDCNRPLDAPDSIATSSDGVAIPGNVDLDPEAMRRRAETFFLPYHAAIAALLDRRAAAGRATALVSIHSFTPFLDGFLRPWDIGVSYRHDRRLAAALLAWLRRDPDLCVGDNQPYAVGDHCDYAIPVHCEARGLPCALIELRQDRVADPADAAVWGGRLAEVLAALTADLDRLQP